MPASNSESGPIQSLIIIGKNWLQAADYTAQPPILTSKIPWTTENLEALLTKTASQLQNKATRIILADNLALTPTLLLPEKEKNIETKVLDKVSQITKQPLEKLGIDWERVTTINGVSVYQIFAVQKPLLSIIGTATQNAKLSVEAVEPLAYVLARKTKNQKQPHLIVHGEGYLTLVLSFQGNVLATSVVSYPDVYKAIDSLLSFSLQKLSLKVSTIIMATKSTKIDPDNIASSSDLGFEEVELNPLADESSQTKIFGKSHQDSSTDSDELFAQDTSPKPKETSEKPKEINLDSESNSDDQTSLEADESDNLDISKKAPKLPLSVAKQEAAETMESPLTSETSKPRAKFFITITIVVAILVGIVIGGVIIYQNATSSRELQAPTPSSTPMPQATAQPTLGTEATGSAQTETGNGSDQTTKEVFDPSQYSIQILNGSGIPGAASKASSVLESANFSDIDTGNADSYDYEQTEISVKPGESQLLDALIEALENNYSIGNTDQTLSEDSQFDAVIIVGSE